ncbi:hypothetical protein ES703_85936 [subsurface metagenome]
MGVLFVQVAAEDHHSLRVCGATHLGLAFDVDDALPPHPDAYGDLAGLAEAIVSQGEHGESVHLAHLLPLGLDEDDVPFDHLVDPFLDEVRPVDLLLQRLADVLPGDQLGALFDGVEVGLPDDVGHRGELGRHLRLVGCEP